MKECGRKIKLRRGIKRAFCFILCGIMLSLCVDSTAFAKVKKIDYDDIGRVSEGFARVKKGGEYPNAKCGFINKKGKEVIKLKYDWVYDFSEGFAVVEKDSKCGLIDKSGTEVTELIYDDIGEFSEGLAVVRKNNSSGYIDKTGKEVIKLKYVTAYDFSDGLALVKKGKFLVINKKGKAVLKQK